MHRFTIMTCNVGNGRARPESLTRALNGCGADLIGIQELSDGQALAVSQGLTTEYPFQVMYPGGFAGKALISRFPITASEQLFLSKERPDLKTTVDFEGCELTFLIAHPPPPRPHWSGARFDTDTWNEIVTLSNMAAENPPTVLIGDFNLIDRRKEYFYIRSLGLKDAFREGGKKRGYTLPKRIGPWKRFIWLNRLLSGFPLFPLLRVDYIWYTPPIQCERAWVGPDTGSDHLPVLATLSLS
jgi:vancomycin resistance protein VanJ